MDIRSSIRLESTGSTFMIIYGQVRANRSSPEESQRKMKEYSIRIF